MTVVTSVIPAALAAAKATRSEDLDGLRHYLYPRDNREFPSITTVLGATNAKPHLKAHAAKVATQFTLDNLDVIAEFLAEGHSKGELVDLIKFEAERIRDRKAAAGSYVHAVVEALILWAATADGRGIEIPPIPVDLATVDMEGVPLRDLIAAMVDGFLDFVKTYDLGPENFLTCEMSVFNPELEVAGTLDIILVLHDVAMGPQGLYRKVGARFTICVDVKTGKHMDATWKPQAASYRRATEALVGDGELVPMPATDASAILWLRPEHGFRLMVVSDEDDLAGWNTFVHALHTYRGYLDATNKPGRVVYPPLADGSPAPTRTLDLFAEGYYRAPLALHKAGIATIGELANWCVEGLLELSGIGEKTIPYIRRILADNGSELIELGDDYPTRGTFGDLEYEQPLTDLATCTTAIANKLTALGITTVGQLACLTETEVRALPGIGAKAVEALALGLADHDLEFDTVAARMARAEVERAANQWDDYDTEEVA